MAALSGPCRWLVARSAPRPGIAPGRAGPRCAAPGRPPAELPAAPRLTHGPAPLPASLSPAGQREGRVAEEGVECLCSSAAARLCSCPTRHPPGGRAGGRGRPCDLSGRASVPDGRTDGRTVRSAPGRSGPGGRPPPYRAVPCRTAPRRAELAAAASRVSIGPGRPVRALLSCVSVTAVDQHHSGTFPPPEPQRIALRNKRKVT